MIHRTAQSGVLEKFFLIYLFLVICVQPPQVLNTKRSCEFTVMFVIFIGQLVSRITLSDALWCWSFTFAWRPRSIDMMLTRGNGVGPTTLESPTKMYDKYRYNTSHGNSSE